MFLCFKLETIVRSALIHSLKHKNTQPLYIYNKENPQNSEPQNGPMRGLDFIAFVKGYEPYHRPWMTAIRITSKEDFFNCGGSIINNYWILSAAHCFCEKLKCKPSKKGRLKIDYKPSHHIKIVTGLKDKDKVDSNHYQESKPQKIIIHPL